MAAVKETISKEKIIQSLEQFYDAFCERVSIWLSNDIPKIELTDSTIYSYVLVAYDYTINNRHVLDDDDELLFGANGHLEPPASLFVPIAQLYAFWSDLKHNDFYMDHMDTFYTSPYLIPPSADSNYAIFSTFVIKTVTKFRTDFPHFETFGSWNPTDDDFKEGQKDHINFFTDGELGFLTGRQAETIKNYDRERNERPYNINKNKFFDEVINTEFNRMILPSGPPDIFSGRDFYKGKTPRGTRSLKDFHAAISILMRMGDYYPCQYVGKALYESDNSEYEERLIPEFTNRIAYAHWLKNSGHTSQEIADVLTRVGLTVSAVTALLDGTGSVNIQLYHMINLKLGEELGIAFFT